MKHIAKRFISLALALSLALCCFTACSKKPEYEKFNYSFLGSFDTIISLVSYHETQEEADEFARTVQAEFQRLNKLYDIYNNYPGINNAKTINDNAGIAPVKVEEDLFNLIKFSVDWYEKTDGKFNIAMGSVLRLWHDVREVYENFGTPSLPDAQKLEEADEHTSIDNIVLDEENMTVFITDPDCRIDIGAVAKGYATELIADKLSEKYPSFIISAGGNVKVNGQPLDSRTRWGIGIENPMVDENFDRVGGNLDRAYIAGEKTLVCSGGYQRYFVYEGERYHHLIDPDTLYPNNTYMGVALLCEDSGVADVLSTAVFMLPPQQALDLVNSMPDADCILVMPDGTTQITEGFKSHLESFGTDSKTPVE